MKIFAQKIIATGVGVLLLTGVPVYGDILYNNSTTDLGRSLNFTNGQAIGNQVVMGNGYTSANLTNFSFEIYSTNASFSPTILMQVFLYANDGATNANGYHMPGTALYNSGSFGFTPPQQFVGNGTNVGTVFFDLTSGPVVTLPQSFTLAVMVTNMSASDTVGMELFNSANVVGLNYNDYWFQTVAGNATSWQLMTNSAGSTDFGSQFNGTGVPEPSTLGLSVVGASLLIGSFWLRRRQNQSRQG
jgi:hypothetical protein